MFRDSPLVPRGSTVPPLKEVASLVRQRDREAWLVIGRSKNKNVVVYRGQGNDTKGFWLLLEPSYHKGKPHDYEDLSVLEGPYYGHQVRPTERKGTYQVTLNAVPSEKFVVTRKKNGKVTAKLQAPTGAWKTVDYIMLSNATGAWRATVHATTGEVWSPSV